METMVFRVWSSYVAQAQNHRERAGRFRRYADETSKPNSRKMYLRIVDAEETLAVTAERLSQKIMESAEGLDTTHSQSEGNPV
jgi:hypothetical protein